MNVPKNLKYTSSHEWCLVEGNVATIGVTDFAQSELGDIVFLQLPEVGSAVTSGQSFVTIEAVKTVADLYSPVGGKVVAVNGALDGEPQRINQDCYGDGWIVKVEMSNPGDADKLLDPDAYGALLH